MEKLLDGYIIKRPDGRYEGRVTRDGKRKSVYAWTKAECVAKLNLVVQRSDDTYTLFTYLDEWLRIYKLGKVTSDWYECLEVAIRCHIKKGLKNRPLSKITGEEIQLFLNASPDSRTKETVYQVLNAVFKKAYATQKIPFNIMLSVTPFHWKRVKGSALSDETRKAFLTALETSPLCDYYKTVLYTGCRRSEALNIKKCDIDFNKNRLYVRGTKTDSAKRYVNIFAPLLPIFKRLTENLKPEALLFNYNADYVTHEFKELCNTHHLHDLRHTFATDCCRAGRSLTVAKEWLGHSSIEITADIYTHATEDFKQNETVNMNLFYTQVLGESEE